ncbi:MAG: hypothetical protein ACOYW3_03180 [Bacteroidota bacterium]
MQENPFDYMDGVHIQQVWTELSARFGFPEKKWKEKFKKHLAAHRGSEEEVGMFLRFGNANINPILNALLLRSTGYGTFNALCEYVIKKSDTYRTRQLRRRAKTHSRYSR